ncbi:MAG TPA: acyltransferase family protein [Gemmataceae bacterium]|nr:acyltransferase family protein [Gemmataceae bacterium]
MPSSTPSPSVAAPARRLLGLDQARALAILAMMVAHFAPGLFKQLPGLSSIETPVLWFGRTATPAFVVVFGVTVGIVFLPRFLKGDVERTRQRLWRRTGLIVLCAVLISVPHFVRMAVHRPGPGEPPPTVWDWVFGTYTVLFFYAIGLALLPAWLAWLKTWTAPKAVAAGGVLWAATVLGCRAWPGESTLTGTEFVRMVLISGPFAYLPMMGTTLVAIPVGLGLYRASKAGTDGRFLWLMLAGGVALAALGAGLGFAAGEYDLDRIVSGDLKAPSRPWYFLHFGGMAVAAIAGLELLTRGVRAFRPVGYVLALFGQTSLVLFTAHMFVLPVLELADHVGRMSGLVRVAVAFVPFAVFCALVMYGQHRYLQRRAAGGE